MELTWWMDEDGHILGNPDDRTPMFEEVRREYNARIDRERPRQDPS